jgi:hypothetical protein
MIFEFDRYVLDRPYPNLARHQAVPYTPGWRQFNRHWPWVQPAILPDYLQHEEFDTTCGTRYYVVALSWFDFGIQWFNLIPVERIKQMQQGQLKLLFYYNEGDNPQRLRDHLLVQCRDAGVPKDQLVIISGNSAADLLPNSAWFPDHELLYAKRNRRVEPIAYHERSRSKLFTALVRTHKFWRAATMAELWRRGWHQHAYFSYNTRLAVEESPSDNPIEIYKFDGLNVSMFDFLSYQFRADTLTSDQHNDHHLIVPEHHNDSYLNLVLETHMDADQSNGVFLTEKTFKPIKHAQPFVIFGAAHSLARLRDMGYRTFDHVLDNRYDSIENTTDRWQCLVTMLHTLFGGGASHMHQLYCACRADILHNQQHFLAPRRDRLNNLLRKINCE